MELGFAHVFRTGIYSKETQGLNSGMCTPICKWMLFVNAGMQRCVPL